MVETVNHRGFRITSNDAPDDPVVIDPVTAVLLVQIATPDLLQRTDPVNGFRLADPDDAPDDGLVDFFSIEWDDDEPDYRVGQFWFPAKQVAEILSYALYDAVVKALANFDPSAHQSRLGSAVESATEQPPPAKGKKASKEKGSKKAKKSKKNR